MLPVPLRKKLRDASFEGDQPLMRSLALSRGTVVAASAGLAGGPFGGTASRGDGAGAGRSKVPEGGESSEPTSVGKEKVPMPPASACVAGNEKGARSEPGRTKPARCPPSCSHSTYVLHLLYLWSLCFRGSSSRRRRRLCEAVGASGWLLGTYTVSVIRQPHAYLV